MNTSSFRQLSIVEPMPYPTIQQFPSHPCILNIEGIDQKLSTLNLDIYSMNMLALQIKQSLMHLQCKLEYFSRCGTRLMMLIDCIFQQFGIDYYHLSKLVGYIRYCNGKWKKQLMRTVRNINYDPKVETVFYYKAERNVYLFCMLKTNNTIICKMTERLITRGQFNSKNKKYLHSKGIGKIYQGVFRKMLQILQQKEDETYFKIQLINEFIMFITLFVQLCITIREEETLFGNFLVVVAYLCRIIRKFYCPKIIKDIQSSFLMLKKGFQTFIRVFQRREVNFAIKVQHIKLIIRLIDRKYQFEPNKLTHQNAFIIKLLQNILANWRKNHLRLQKAKLNKVRLENEELKQAQVLKKKQDQNQVYNRLNTRKVSISKLQIIKINKSMSNLNRRKSIKKSDSCQTQGKQLFLSKHLQERKTNITIRREIEHVVDHFFQNMTHLKQSKSFSKDKKRVMSCKNDKTEEKQLKLQDYTKYLNSRIKVIPNSNKIQLYQPDKMANYYRTKPKTKLKLNL